MHTHTTLTKAHFFLDREPNGTNCLKEECGEVRLKSDFPSPFELFMHRTANMPSIWEEIISKLSGEDVALCLRVNRALRSAIGQCLMSNTRLREKMDAKATACAFGKGILKSNFQVQFISREEINGRDGFFALDNIWYYRQHESRFFDVLKLEPDFKNVLFKKSFNAHKIVDEVVYPIVALPTEDEKRFFVNDATYKNRDSLTKYAVPNLIEAKTHRAKLITNNDNPFHAKDASDTWIELLNDSEQCQSPYCVRYRMYQLRQRRDDFTTKVVLAFLKPNGEFNKSVVVYDGTDHNTFFHLPSNDEVKM